MSKKSESNAEAADLFLTEKKHAQCCFFKLRLKVLELEVWWSTFFHHFTRANVIKAVKWFSVTQILCAQAGYNCHSDEEIKICATAEDQENRLYQQGGLARTSSLQLHLRGETEKKENSPLLGPLHTEPASLIRLFGRLVPTALLLNQQTTAKYSQGDSSFLFVCFLAPTTSLWGLMGNYKIKNIKNLENLHTVFMNFTAANKILFY